MQYINIFNNSSANLHQIHKYMYSSINCHLNYDISKRAIEFETQPKKND